MTHKLGKDCKLYFQTTGTRAAWPATGAAPNLAEIENCRDLTFSGDTAEADVSVRGGGGWRQQLATLRDAEVSFEMVYDTDDTDFTSLRDNWSANTVFGLAILDGDSATSGTKGIWMDCSITGWEESQELEEAAKVQVTCKNAYSSVALELVTVG